MLQFDIRVTVRDRKRNPDFEYTETEAIFIENMLESLIDEWEFFVNDRKLIFTVSMAKEVK